MYVSPPPPKWSFINFSISNLKMCFKIIFFSAFHFSEERSTPKDEKAPPEKRKKTTIERPQSAFGLFAVEIVKQIMQDAINKGNPKPGVG